MEIAGVEVGQMLEPEIVAALVHHSIGYLSPRGAQNHLDYLKNGNKGCACEGCMACHHGNAAERLRDAIRYWSFFKRDNPQAARVMMENMKPLMGMDTITAMGFSAMYPTMAP